MQTSEPRYLYSHNRAKPVSWQQRAIRTLGFAAAALYGLWLIDSNPAGESNNNVEITEPTVAHTFFERLTSADGDKVVVIDVSNETLESGTSHSVYSDVLLNYIRDNDDLENLNDYIMIAKTNAELNEYVVMAGEEVLAGDQVLSQEAIYRLARGFTMLHMHEELDKSFAEIVKTSFAGGEDVPVESQKYLELYSAKAAEYGIIQGGGLMQLKTYENEGSYTLMGIVPISERYK